MAVVLTLVVVMATSVAALAAVDKFAADFEQDTLAGVYRTRVCLLNTSNMQRGRPADPQDVLCI